MNQVFIFLFKVFLPLMMNPKNFIPNFKNPEVASSIYEWILQGSYEIFPGIFLIRERFIITKQKKDL